MSNRQAGRLPRLARRLDHHRASIPTESPPDRPPAMLRGILQWPCWPTQHLRHTFPITRRQGRFSSISGHSNVAILGKIGTWTTLGRETEATVSSDTLRDNISSVLSTSCENKNVIPRKHMDNSTIE